MPRLNQSVDAVGGEQEHILAVVLAKGHYAAAEAAIDVAGQGTAVGAADVRDLDGGVVPAARGCLHGSPHGDAVPVQVPK